MYWGYKYCFLDGKLTGGTLHVKLKPLVTKLKFRAQIRQQN